MEITFYGHACFGLSSGNTHLVIDPFITDNPLAKDIDVNQINADYILVTHAHGDHVADVESIANRTKALIVSNYEIINHFGAKSLKGHPLGAGGKKEFDFGTVKYVTAQHTSSFPDGTYGGNPGGFVINTPETCCYIAGDTALTMDMKLIPMTSPKLDFAILPIGDNFTMGYEDAVIASDFIACDTIIGCHFDTFGYIKINHEAAKKAFANKGKKLILMQIGETISI